jgi:hypothetical protein
VAGPGAVKGEMEGIHGGLEGYPEAMEAHPGAGGNPRAVELWRLNFESCIYVLN